MFREEEYSSMEKIEIFRFFFSGTFHNQVDLTNVHSILRCRQIIIIYSMHTQRWSNTQPEIPIGFPIRKWTKIRQKIL